VIQSVDRAVRILIALQGARSMSLGEIASAVGLPPSTVHGIVRTLLGHGMVTQESDTGRYRLGPAIFRMSANVMAAWNFAKVLRPFMVELSSACKETVYLGVLDVEEKVVTYVEVLESAQSVRYSMTVGQRRPLYCTAAGRVLLAHAPAPFLDTYLDTVKLEALTPRTKSTREALLAELALIRETGIAVSKGELVSESGGMSVPVRSPDGTVIAAMAIGAPLERFETHFDRLQEILLGVARRASGSACPR